MNMFICTGNLTRDPELSETTSGIAVCRMSIAVNRTFGEGVDYFNIVAWRGQAENCAKYLAKGRKIAVKGRLENRSYETSNGEKRTVTEVVAEEVEFLSPNTAEPKQAEPTIPDDDSDDLPF